MDRLLKWLRQQGERGAGLIVWRKPGMWVVNVTDNQGKVLVACRGATEDAVADEAVRRLKEIHGIEVDD